MNSPKPVVIRTYLIYSLVVIAMVVVVVKTVSIILTGGKEVYEEKTNEIPHRFAKIESRRGEILDKNLHPLATSVSYYDIYMDPTVVDDELWNKGITELCSGLAKLFPKKSARDYESYLRNARSRGDRYVLIHKRATNEIREKVRKLPIFKAGRFEGGLIDNYATIIRKTPHGELLRRTLGYVKTTEKDTLLVGIEGAYNTFLAGQEGVVVQQRIARSWEPTGAVVREPKEGYDVVTTINLDIQEVAHRELLHQLESEGGRYGCAIVMDVNTGYIRAMVNLQQTQNGDYHEIYNNAIGTRQILGSTMKLASVMACIEDGKVKMSDTINADGVYKFYDKELEDSHKGGYGKISIEEAFAYSSNVLGKVVYDAYKDNPQNYLNRLKQFGLTEKTGIKIKGEAQPKYSFPGSSTWWGASLAWMAIGYEFAITPLQMLSFYNAVANDGKYMKPQLVSNIIDNRKNSVKTFKPIVKYEQIAKPSSIKAMQHALKSVVDYGTGQHLKSAYFKIAGKTGTAQKADLTEEGKKKYIATFAGYFPADEPIYSCIVVVAAPTKDIYGASVSGSVFKAIADQVYATSYKYHDAVNEKDVIVSTPKVQNGNRYDLNLVLNQLGVNKELHGTQPWVKTSFGGENKVAFNGYNFIDGLVPNVTGMGLNDALFLLEKQGLKVNVKGAGRVVSQSISPGKKAAIGDVILLQLN